MENKVTHAIAFLSGVIIGSIPWITIYFFM